MFFYLLVLCFALLDLSAPPGKLPLYVAMFVLSLVAVFFNVGKWRVLSVIALILAIGLSSREIISGRNLKKKTQQILDSRNKNDANK